MRLGTGGGVAGGGASVRISDKQDAEFLCKFCDNRKFKSSPNPPSQLPNGPYSLARRKKAQADTKIT